MPINPCMNNIVKWNMFIFSIWFWNIHIVVKWQSHFLLPANNISCRAYDFSWSLQAKTRRGRYNYVQGDYFFNKIGKFGIIDILLACAIPILIPSPFPNRDLHNKKNRLRSFMIKKTNRDLHDQANRSPS